MKQLLTSALLLLTFLTNAQTFEIGHTTITFNDPNRTGGFGSGGGPGRQIQSEIYYPADIAGTDVNVANGTFPVIAFGHGFVMAWDAYANIWETLVPEGYIIVFPRTEGGFSPDHEEFGTDLAQIVEAMNVLNTDNSSLLYQHIGSDAAIMGHSMGGGATMLAAANNSNIKTIIGLAPAETTPSAIQAASSIDVPALIFSADEDAVTPASVHHQPIYDNLNSSCKYFINILGGGHCYYANPNFNCDFGEGSSGGNITITRAEQQAIMNTYLLPWLEMYLKVNCSASDAFMTDLPNDSNVTYQSECINGLHIYNTNISLLGSGLLKSMQDNTTYQWLDCDNNFAVIPGATSQLFQATSDGNYAVQLGDGICVDTSDCVNLLLNNLNDLNVANITIYPNPSEGKFVIESAENGVFTLVSMHGSELYSGSLTEGINPIEVRVASGIYVVEITLQSGSVSRKYIGIN